MVLVGLLQHLDKLTTNMFVSSLWQKKLQLMSGQARNAGGRGERRGEEDRREGGDRGVGGDHGLINHIFHTVEKVICVGGKML